MREEGPALDVWGATRFLLTTLLAARKEKNFEMVTLSDIMAGWLANKYLLQIQEFVAG